MGKRFPTKLRTGMRVICEYDPDKTGVVLKAGDEVSAVRWDEDTKEVYIVNRHLTEASG